MLVWSLQKIIDRGNVCSLLKMTPKTWSSNGGRIVKTLCTLALLKCCSIEIESQNIVFQFDIVNTDEFISIADSYSFFLMWHPSAKNSFFQSKLLLVKLGWAMLVKNFVWESVSSEFLMTQRAWSFRTCWSVWKLIFSTVLSTRKQTLLMFWGKIPISPHRIDNKSYLTHFGTGYFDIARFVPLWSELTGLGSGILFGLMLFQFEIAIKKY